MRGRVAVGDLAEDVQEQLRAHGLVLEKMQKTAERQLFYRQVSTVAAIVGAGFAIVSLQDIWGAVKRRRGGRGE